MTFRKDGIDCMARVNAARDILAALPGICTRSWTEERLGAEDGLHTGAALPSDRCHLDDAAVSINRHHRDHTAIGEKYMVERTIGVHQDLRALAANLFKLRHKRLRLRDGRASNSRLRGQFDEAFMPLNPARFASAPRGDALLRPQPQWSLACGLVSADDGSPVDAEKVLSNSITGACRLR